VTAPFWLAGTASGVGSLPGVDPAAAARLVLDELPALPHLAELPERGTGADLVGRSTALLVDLPVDLQPAGWRLVARPGRELRRTQDLLARDLDALEEAGQGYAGPLKVQAAGPWTLASVVELTRGDKVLADASACRDLAASLGEGLAAQVTDLRRRLPGSTDLLVQLDEPSLPAVLAGHVRSASGFATLRVPEPAEVEGALQAVAAAVTAAGGVPGAHCCATAPPLATFTAGGARFLSLDVTTLTPRDDDAVGTALEAGVPLLAGLLPTSGRLPTVAQALRPLRDLLDRLGATDRAAEVAVTPTCGLAAAGAARAVLRRARECAEELVQ